MRLVLALITTLAATTANAQLAPKAYVERFRNMASTNTYDYLQQVALNASAATRTIVLPVGDRNNGLVDIVLVIDYTYSAATTVTVTPSCSLDGGTTYGQETSTSITAGAGTVSAYADTYTTGGASKTLKLTYTSRGCTHVKFVFGGASAGAGDLVDVQAAAVVGG